MAGRSPTRAVSITIGYVVLLAALFVIHVGRQQIGRDDRPAQPQVTSPPPAPQTETAARIDKPAAIDTTKVEGARPPATAPDRVVPMAPERHAPLGRSRVRAPETSTEESPALPAPAETAATTGDARTTPAVDRTETPLPPAPAVPPPTAIPNRVGELVEPVAALPRPVVPPEVRDMSPADRIYQKESSALARVLGHYEQAYDRLDAHSAAAVWPSVDARALSRAFARLQSQDIDFGNCTFSVSASDAAARCAGVLRYAQRIGDTALKTEQHIWTIEFARAGESWQIVKISAQ
jgi:hypothetical protein